MAQFSDDNSEPLLALEHDMTRAGLRVVFFSVSLQDESRLWMGMVNIEFKGT